MLRKNILQKFVENAGKHPNRDALVFGANSMSYAELDRRSNEVANWLLSKEMEPSSVVGIALGRGFDLIASILGTLKAGHAYLPLDLSYPKTRLEYMFKHSRSECLLTDGQFTAKSKRCLDLTKFNGDASAVPPVENDLVYVIYTSGSSGLPKGVALGSEPLWNLLNWQKETSAGGKTLQFSPASFDVHFQEIFSTLLEGDTLVLVSEDIRLDFEALLVLIQRESIQRLFLPYVALNGLCKTAVSSGIFPESLKEVATAGEQLKVNENIRAFFSNTGAILFNHYGPSETHVVTSYLLEGAPSSWVSVPPIGREITNARLLILDDSMSPADEGELYIGGPCLAKGYLHDRDRTDERFVQIKGSRFYRTGDLVKKIDGGSLQFLGRIDGQEKLRGFRLELGEVEAVIESLTSQSEVCAKIFRPDHIEPYLAVFIKGEFDERSLRARLVRELPEYMLPRFYMGVEYFPLTPSGKVDRNALLPPAFKRPELAQAYTAPINEREELLADIWSQILGIEEVGVYDSFFDLGGSSLMAMELLQEIKKMGAPDVGIADIFENQSISKQCEFFVRSDLHSTYPTGVAKSVKRRGGDVAIVSMTGRFPGADSIGEFNDLLREARSGLTTFAPSALHPSVEPSVLKDENYKLVKGEFSAFDCFDNGYFGVAPLEAKLMDPQQRKFLELCHEALELAGISPSAYNGKIGVYAGSSHNTYVNAFKFHEDLVKQFGEFNLMLGNDKDYLPSRVAHKLGLTGPAISVNTGCSTSLVAIVQAVEAIRAGLCECALAGGVAIAGERNKGYLYQEGSIFSKDGRCRPYDAEATGTVFSDGAGVVLLKSHQQALADGDPILAVIKGVGINNDGKDKMSFTAPSVKGQKDAIKMAIADADIAPDVIEYIEGHGTATPIGDPIETKALEGAFREMGASKKQFCALGSVKSNVGHTTSAAGVTGLIKTILGLNAGVMPATFGISKTNPEIDFNESFFVPNKEEVKLSSKEAFAGVSSFGVGGTNAHIILRGFARGAEEREEAICEELFLLSAKNKESLSRMMDDLDSRLEKDPHLDTAYTLSSRDLHRFRASRTSSGSWSALSEAKKQKNAIFMFPGQGAQYAGMGKSLCERFPVFREALEECHRIASLHLDRDLRAVVFSEDAGAQEVLNDTFYAQPAIFSFEYALGRLLLNFGIKPDGFIGHSIGEFAAAAMNGVFSLKDAIRIVCKRSQLMSDMERGVMLSAPICFENAVDILPRGVQIAAVNGKDSIVFAGPEPLIQTLEARLEGTGVASARLRASHAFHSEMMRPMVEEFREFLETIEFHTPSGNIYSTVTGKLESELLTKPSYWAEHVVKPVLFAPTISKLLDENTLFVEVGPRSTLKTLTAREASTHKIKAFAIASNNGMNRAEPGGEQSTFLKCLGQLWTQGAELDSQRLFEGRNARVIPTTTYAFAETKHWLEQPREEAVIDTKKETKEMSNILGIKGHTFMDAQRNSKLKNDIVKIFEEASGVDLNQYSEDTCFLEMGLDSLFLTQISLKLKKELQVEIGFRRLTEDCSDLGSLMEWIAERMPESVDGPKSVDEGERHAEDRHETVELKEEGSPRPYPDQVPKGGVERLIADQLSIMREQLALLGGQQDMMAESFPSSTKKSSHAIEKHSKTQELSEKKEQKVFGAMAKIDSQKRKNVRHPEYFQKFISDYNERTKTSKLHTQEGRKKHADPRAVTGFRPETKEIVYPVVVKGSKGQRLYDLDGNEYVDMLCGFGSNFFGNGNSRITRALRAMLDQGIEIGPQHPLSSEVSALIGELTGNERSAFCNTGSEAVLGALRIARTSSGKNKVIVFSDSYHGINDEVIARGAKDGKAYPAAPGILPEAVENMIVLDYGTEESLQKIQALCEEGDVAAVLVEPVQSRRCDFHPKEFLRELRKVTLRTDVCLIFDEVITGFRILPGGAQAFFDVRADLCVYGKIVGGGMPIGVVSGKAKYMDALDGGYWSFGDASVPTAGVTYFAGTFVRHPLALAAAKEALLIIKDGGEQMLNELNERAGDWVDDVNQICSAFEAPLTFARFGSLLKPKYKESDFHNSEFFFALLRHHGLHVYEGFPWFINLAHTREDLDFAKNAIIKALRFLQENGEIKGPGIEIQTPALGGHIKPPEAGARLGKDEEGNPAWFIQSSEKNGAYVQL